MSDEPKVQATPIVLTCGVCGKNLGGRDASIGDACPACSRMRPVHAHIARTNRVEWAHEPNSVERVSDPKFDSSRPQPMPQMWSSVAAPAPQQTASILFHRVHSIVKAEGLSSDRGALQTMWRDSD
jgi:hypothetical protein